MRTGEDLIEVKADFQIDEDLVRAKANAANEMTVESGFEYLMYPGSKIMKTNVLEDPDFEKASIPDTGVLEEILLYESRGRDSLEILDKPDM